MALEIFSTLQILSSFRTRLLEDSLVKNNKQLSSNGLGGTYSDIKDTISYLSGEMGVKSADTKILNNVFLIEKAQFVSGQLDRISDINTRLVTIIRDTRSMTIAPHNGFFENIRNVLRDLDAELNNQFLSETTLAGNAGNHRATVDLSTIAEVSSTTQPDASYYIGGRVGVVLSASETKDIDISPLTAADPSIQRTICAARMCLGADYTNTNDPNLYQALVLLDEAEYIYYPNAIMKVDSVVQRLESIQEEETLTKMSSLNQIQASYGETLLDVLREHQENETALDVAHYMNIQWLKNLKEFSRLITDI